jgi:hypothetical protein
MTRNRSIRLFALVSAIVVVVGSTACSSAARTASPSAPPQLASEVNGKAGAAVAPGAPAPAVSDAAARTQPASANASTSLNLQTEAAAALPPDRMVIRTAQLVVEVGDMESALAQVRQIAQQGGGFVSASNTRVEKVNDLDRTVADLTIQVRSDTVDNTLSALRGLGKITTETSGSQDVTEEYIDLDSNLRNLQASESAVLKLMDKATRIEDVLALQRELTNIRGQIERIQGRKRFIERRTDMATITLSLRLPPVEGSKPILGGAWDPAAVAARGWAASLTVLRGLADVVIVVLAFSWWLIPLVGLGVYIWTQRRRPTRPTAPAAPAEAA